MHTLNTTELIKLNGIDGIIDNKISLADIKKIDLIESLGLIKSNPDFSTFAGRLQIGTTAEQVALLAFALGIIENQNCQMSFKVNSSNPRSKDANAINGDIQFIAATAYTDLKCQFVDVKLSGFISEHSLNSFRTEDSWYFLNAFVISNNQHFLIRNNEAFKEFVKQFPARRSSNGYDLKFKDIPSEPKKYGLELYPFMSPNLYNKLLMELRVQYDAKGLDFNKIIKVV